MKFILVCLSFYLAFDFISTLDPFNIQRQHHEYDVFDIDHRDSPLLELESDQHSYSQLNGTNRPQSRKNKYHGVNPKFRPWLQIRRKNRTQTSLSKATISSILKDNMPLIELHQTDGKLIAKTTRPSSLLQMLTPKPRMSFGDYYFRQQLQAFFKHQHEKFPAPTRSFIKTGLR